MTAFRFIFNTLAALCFLLTSIVFIDATAPAAANAATKAPTQKEFEKTYQRNLKELRKKLSADLQDPCIPDPNYDPDHSTMHFPNLIALSEFCATQSVYSFYKISLELNKSKPSEKTVDYVLYRGRKYLVDGHHHVLLSLYRGHEFISAKVVAKFSDALSPVEFVQEMKKLNFVYDQLIDPMLMEDSPYLNKVREMIHDTESHGAKIILKGKSQRGEMIGALMPNKPYYSENRHAEILEESNVSLKDIDGKKAIEIFEEVQKNDDPRTEILVLLDKPIDIRSEKDFKEAQELIHEKIKKRKPVRPQPRHCSRSLQPDTPP